MDTLVTASPEQTEAVGEELARRLSPGAVVIVEGPLGSGKTTFVRGVARGLGVRDTVTSPSYSIIVEYGSPTKLLHIDLYRTGSAEELLLLGLEEALASAAVKVIEWGDKARGLLPDDPIRVSIRIIDGDRREIAVQGIRGRSA